MTYYYGVDLHPTYMLVCRRKVVHPKTNESDGQSNGKPEFCDTFTNYAANDKGIAKLRGILKPEDHIAVEACPNAYWFVQKLSADVESISMVNTKRFTVIRNSTNKTDKNDARVLAEYLVKDMLPTCRIKSEESRHASSLTNSRDKFVCDRTRCVNKIHGYYTGIGQKMDKESLKRPKHLNCLDLSEFSETQKFDVENLRKQILHLNSVIADYDKKIEELGGQMDGFQGLTSIKGIASLSATIFLSEIDDIEDFQNFKAFSSYLGFVPSIRESGGKSKHGPITKNGSDLFRKTLVQCTWAAMRHSPYLQQYYDRMKASRGKGRALIATARKLLKVIYMTLKNGWVFNDFGKYELA